MGEEEEASKVMDKTEKAEAEEEETEAAAEEEETEETSEETTEETTEAEPDVIPAEKIAKGLTKKDFKRTPPVKDYRCPKCNAKLEERQDTCKECEEEIEWEDDEQ